MSKRCKHTNARVLWRKGDRVDCFCDDCKSGWIGDLTPRMSRRHHFTRNPPRLIKPPKWVTRTVENSSGQ